MAAYNQWHQASLQHLAHRKQLDLVHRQRQISEHQVPQVALAEAALEAHLRQRLDSEEGSVVQLQQQHPEKK